MSVTILMKCGCSRVHASPVPGVGENVYCPKHPLDVNKRVRDGFVVKCRECTYTRCFGESRLTADVYCSKHRATRRHIVDILLCGEVVFTTTEQTIPFDFESYAEDTENGSGTAAKLW